MRRSRVSKGAEVLIPNCAINVALCPLPWGSLLNRGRRLFTCIENIEEVTTVVFLKAGPLPMVKGSKSKKEVINNFKDLLITSFCSLT